jgi:uncharacterized membrane protein
LTDRQRVASLDILRGAIMAIMALDHVRLFITNAAFSPTDLSQTTAAYFFTRWITHFCAPGFVFLAGTGAFLYGTRVQTRRELSRFLLTRGAWLVLMELTILRFAWTFNFDYPHYVLGGVIWMIGWCLILMAGLVYLPVRAIATIGLIIIAGHNLSSVLMPSIMPAIRASGLLWLWQIGYSSGVVSVGGLTYLFVLFSIVPWIGVMAAGYAFGTVITQPPARRDRLCYAIGLGAVALFVLLRTFNIYGDPRPWAPQRDLLFSLLSFLNTSKYPASLLFLLMTLGPMIALIPLLDRARGRLARDLATIGRVPFFYYVLHIPLIHLTACALSLVRYGAVVPWLRLNHPLGVDDRPPEGWGYGLPVVYLVTIAIVITLYFLCRWFDDVKRRRRDWWLRYF